MTISILSSIENYENSINYALNQLSPNKIYDSIIVREDWELGKQKELSSKDIQNKGFFSELINSKNQVEIAIPYRIYNDYIILEVEINGNAYDGGVIAKQDGNINIKINYNTIAAQEFENKGIESDYFGELFKLANKHLERIFLTICGQGEIDKCPWEFAVLYNENIFSNFYNCRMVYHNHSNKFLNDILVSIYCKENNLYVPDLWSKNKELFQIKTNFEIITHNLHTIASILDSINLIEDEYGRQFLISLTDHDLSEFYKQVRNI